MSAGRDELGERLLQRLTKLYGAQAPRVLERLRQALRVGAKPRREPRDQRDLILISYGDSILRGDEPPLETLGKFLHRRLRGVVSAVHILPFFPFSSDDGYAVEDYEEVNPALGEWADVETVSEEFDMMFDLVLNHVSSSSLWFKAFLAQKGRGKDYFVELPADADLSQAAGAGRPPVLSRFQTASGPKHVWTTFSRDQVDLNYGNPDVLLDMADIFQSYLLHGARFVRLASVAFVWKRLGTSCIHLQQTHEVVKLLRDVADVVAPGTMLVTGAKVSNRENRSYFGQGDEAHLVYQYTLAPLLLHALYSGSAEYLTAWARKLEEPPPGCAYVNLTASHDGIALRPIEGLLPAHEVDRLIRAMGQAGGHASGTAADGKACKAYEINITYFDALARCAGGGEEHHLERFLASQLIALALRGIPALYIHALTATPNDHEAVRRTGQFRSINRHHWDHQTLEELLDAPYSPQHRVFHALTAAIRMRRGLHPLHPDSPQTVLELAPEVLAFERGPWGPRTERLLVIANMADTWLTLELPDAYAAEEWLTDLLSGDELEPGERAIELDPYQVLWLRRSA